MVAVSEITLPKATSYSSERLNLLSSRSAAFARYLEILKTPIDELHKVRHSAWLDSVAATVFGSATTVSVCRFWSDTADKILIRAWQMAGLSDESAALFALGKLGAQELNLSSDVDLVVIADAGSQLTTERKIRAFRKILTDASEFGFCFRLDFDLRPGGQSQTMAPTPAQFQEHYWSRGEAWEKMALTRLRPLTGTPAVTAVVVEHAKKFSFRKFLDFTLLEDLRQVRSRIHNEGFEQRPGEIHLKLQRGGIRDIELFINAMQVLHGGKIPRLQSASTEQTFGNLRDLGLVPKDEIDFLQASYWRFRHWENLSQALDDRQTHFIYWPCPWRDLGWPARQEVESLMARVDGIVSSFLGPANMTLPEIPSAADQPTWLQNLGFNETSVNEIWPSVIAASTLSQKTDRDERARRRFLFTMITELSKSANDKNLGLALLHDFIRSVRAKAPFFTMLNREPKLIADIARLISFSPYLGSLFAARPELIDSFVLNVDEPFSVEFETSLDEMAGRKFVSAVMASVRFLSDLNASLMMDALTNTADVIATELIGRLSKEYGAQPMDLLCLGKWGGRELGLKSDLDFIFLCAKPPSENDQKTAKRFISRLTDPYRGGSLYDIDLRLRPSGKAGPILTTPENLNEYLGQTSDIWERQAYLRARPLKAESPIALQAIWQRPIVADELKKLWEIRGRLLKIPSDGKIDIKYAPGGLVDVELAAQTACLTSVIKTAGPNTGDMLSALGETQWKKAASIVGKNYFRLRTLEQLLTLAGNVKSSEFRRNHETVSRCARLLQRTEADLEAEITALLKENQDLLGAHDPRQNL